MEDARAAFAAFDRCEKRHFLRCHLYIKVIFLPRQARDKHRENSKKSGVFRRDGSGTLTPDELFAALKRLDLGLSDAQIGAENAVFCAVLY